MPAVTETPRTRRVTASRRSSPPARGARYFVREGIEGVKRNGLMSVAAATVTMVTLLALGVALVVADSLGQLAQSLERKVQVVVYLREGLGAGDLAVIRDRLERLPGVTGVTYVSKDEALAQFQTTVGARVNLRDLLPSNPLPASFILGVDDPARVRALAAAARALPQVEGARAGAEAVDRLVEVTRVIRLAGTAATVGLALVAMLIIVTTIRLTVFARREEIEIMRLVGATAWFIRWPFVVEGAITGIGGALAALLVVGGAYAWLVWGARAASPWVPLLAPEQVALALTWKLLLWGLLIGVLGSLLAVRRHLHL